MIKRALISVSDKNGIVDFAKELAGLQVEIISTGERQSFFRRTVLRLQVFQMSQGFLNALTEE